MQAIRTVFADPMWLLVWPRTPQLVVHRRRLPIGAILYLHLLYQALNGNRQYSIPKTICQHRNHIIQRTQHVLRSRDDYQIYPTNNLSIYFVQRGFPTKNDPSLFAYQNPETSTARNILKQNQETYKTEKYYNLRSGEPQYINFVFLAILYEGFLAG